MWGCPSDSCSSAWTDFSIMIPRTVGHLHRDYEKTKQKKPITQSQNGKKADVEVSRIDKTPNSAWLRCWDLAYKRALESPKSENQNR